MVKDDVFEKDVFDIVRFRRVLTDGADWHTARAVACYVSDVEIRGVAFHGDAVIAWGKQCGSESDATRIWEPTILHGPVLKADVSRVPSVGPICIYRYITIITSGVHEDIGDGDVARIGNKGVPELGLGPRQPVHEQVRGVVERNRNRPTWLITIVHVLIVPDLSYSQT